MKRTAILFSVILVWSSLLSGEKLMEIKESFKYGRLYVDEQRLYMADLEACIIHVYAREDCSHRFTFGRKGEGPGEFKYIMEIVPQPDRICVISPDKVSYFSYSGKLVGERKVPFRFLQLALVGDNFVVHFSKGDNKKVVSQYILYDEAFTEKKKLFEFEREGNLWSTGMAKQKYYILAAIPGLETYKDKIIVGDPRETFHFTVYDQSGEKIRDFTRAYEKEKIPEEYKKAETEKFKASRGSGWERFEARFDITWPKYFPSFSSFKVADDRIYVLSAKIRGERREMMVLDFDGNLLKTASIPRGVTYGIYDGTFYYLKDNEDTGSWEIHFEKIID